MPRMTGGDYIGDYNPNDKDDVERIKNISKNLINVIQRLPNSDDRRKAIACTKIEEAAMMAVKSIFGGK